MKKLNSKYRIQYLQILIIALIPNTTIIGQIDEKIFIDNRDKKKYELLEVDQLIWFIEDLRFDSETPYKLIRKGEKEKYFYSNNHLDSLCPKPFRIPTGIEWGKAITKLYDVRNTTHEKGRRKKENYLVFKIDMDSTFYLKKHLNIERSGWVQGNKHVETNLASYWVNEKGKLNHHIHFWEKDFIEHTHKHHIVGKKKKRRKFLVRCVCEKQFLD